MGIADVAMMPTGGAVSPAAAVPEVIYNCAFSKNEFYPHVENFNLFLS